MDSRVVIQYSGRLVSALAFAPLLFLSTEAAPPIVPAGLDAYLQWDRLPYQRIGERAYMRSTYDRSGGNEGADASHFLYQQADDFNVAVDVKGNGILYFARYNHWHGSPWHYEVDGTDHIVKESSTDHPDAPTANSIFLPQTAFPSPLAWTWSQTQGADLEWVPVPFLESFRMAYARTHYGTGYFIYHLFADPDHLSRPLRPFDFSAAPDPAALDLIRRSGTDIAPLPGTPQGDSAAVSEQEGILTLPARDSAIVFQAAGHAATIRALKLSAPKSRAIAFGNALIRMTWDDRRLPSVEAPLNLFFGTGSFYNRDNKDCLVKAFLVSVCFDSSRINLAAYFPMPFFKSCRIELINRDSVPFPNLKWSVRTQPYTDEPGQSAYFHASFRDHGAGVPGQDLVFLDTKGTEGSTDWSGNFIGTSFIFSTEGNLQTLEGDPRFFFDDGLSPQAYGTGTEEWGGGGDYWGGRNMTIPFAGHPVGASAAAALNAEDKINSAYRFLIADCMPFGRNARIQFEHGGTDNLAEHYRSVTYWYGLPAASLIPTDSLKIGNAASEEGHSYRSPSASKVYVLKSAYDGTGPVSPIATDSGHTLSGTTTFKLLLDPDNYGILLRRKMDYAYPNQTAEVSVAGDTTTGWQSAGVWYCPGSTRSVYSNPGSELGATAHIPQTSDRRLREEEFLLSRRWTEGRRELWIRIKAVADATPLFPGMPFPNASLWSEMSYKVYCWKLPAFNLATDAVQQGHRQAIGSGFHEIEGAQGQTQFTFQTLREAKIEIRISTLQGKRVATPFASRLGAGGHLVNWEKSVLKGIFIGSLVIDNRVSASLILFPK